MSTLEISGWGRHPRMAANVQVARTVEEARRIVRESAPAPLLPRGNGRSYGDSSLAAQVLDLRGLDHFLAFDAATGVLRCGAGVTLNDILETFVPRGWFVPSTPGTRFITMGGAIASDVHGKSHHLEGCFSRHVRHFTLLLGNGDLLRCSPDENAELFHATCGGMGLTGLVLEAEVQLIRINSSHLDETTTKTRSLAEALVALRESERAPYSVAWVDCLTNGPQRGRSLVMHGAFRDDSRLDWPRAGGPSVPIDAPAWVLNRHAMRAFNTLYYHRVQARQSQRVVHAAPFFYPLDAIGNWNRLYGKSGFTQYQFVLPFGAEAVLDRIHARIVDSGRGSFLAVLKTLGAANDNPLSFPLAGFTLAVDFKWEDALLPWLDELDAEVRDHGGRVYLTKDVRLSREHFRAMYPRWEAFANIRMRYHGGRFQSLQSSRLGL
jgi:decaprenylphospho-beta-D-ribofuranose 2-oxidase